MQLTKYKLTIYITLMTQNIVFNPYINFNVIYFYSQIDIINFMYNFV